VSVTAESVRTLRERTGAGMMECKKALVETSGDLDAAAELMRKQGLAKADKKASRIAAEGVIVIERSSDGHVAAMAEINCETDFVAREQDFRNFAAAVVRLTLQHKPAHVEALLAAELAAGESVDARRRALVAKIGENISVRRSTVLESKGPLGAYVHGTRIGALVSLEGGTPQLAHDLAMHIAASNPRYINLAEVPGDIVAKEREILSQAATKEGKSPQIVAKMIEGRLRKSLNEITLLGQAFVKDPDQSIEKLLNSAGARVLRFERFEVGSGIEKKTEDFVAAVMAEAKRHIDPKDPDPKDPDPKDPKGPKGH
jgi:elongation factor Ts